MADTDEVYSDFGDDLSERLETPPAHPEKRQATLIVKRNRQEKTVKYRLLLPSKAGSKEKDIPFEGVGGVDYERAFNFFKYTEHHLHELALGAGRMSSWGNIRARVQGLGHKIAVEARIVPVLDMLADELNRGDILYIQSNESWLPWEIIFDSKEKVFLGEQYVIARNKNNREDVPVPAPAPRPTRVYSEQLSLIINAVGNNTRCASQALKLFDGLCEGKIKAYNPTHRKYFSVAELMGLTEREADILHFTCHGVVDAAGERYLQLGPSKVDHHLYSMMLESLDLGGKILFINACSSLSPYETTFSARTDLSTFGWLIQRRGGGAVIGTLAPVPGPAAIEFAQQFYSNLLGKSLNIGDALFEAKSSLAERGAPHGLIYSLYGDPLLLKSVSGTAQEVSIND